jgi:hypothetical protein
MQDSPGSQRNFGCNFEKRIGADKLRMFKPRMPEIGRDRVETNLIAQIPLTNVYTVLLSYISLEAYFIAKRGFKVSRIL